MNPAYVTVAERANHACEYCHAPELVFNFPFEVEHIQPVCQGGSSETHNLALSCRSCNLRKGSRIEAVDPNTTSIVPLFHPRQMIWAEHFQIDSATGEIFGCSAVGRATVITLRLNSPSQLKARQLWIQLNLFP
jgi:hypothetical protein